jgi:hypothetical protein
MQYALHAVTQYKDIVLYEIRVSRNVGAVREPPVYRDMEHRTDIITQQQDFV